jgi:hypothetical protein
MARHQPCRDFNLSLPVECVQQRRLDHAGGRHIEMAS